VQLQFDDYRRGQLNMAVRVVVLVLGLCWAFSRDPIITGSYGSGVDVNKLFLVHLIVSLSVVPVIGMSWFLRLAVVSRRYNIVRLLPYHDWAVGVSQSRYRNWCENVVIIIVTLMMHLFILASLVQSACPPATVLWNVHTCNYTDSLAVFPLDKVLVTFITPALCQLFLPGASYVSTCHSGSGSTLRRA
jgi:hypothetical protein